ncbi:hypothetical protein PHLCEN_2v12600 [Hermanssonia centrifuga]|uniref:Uncharacterized protein n=1 Tax=Hermanssonia centrifuga TaxID=98765 RepID=A0A2R6NGK6_9APHY|nr:hypothetical protein PHLCEN_2v12600 [Hermanssonia centrifuga]
MKRALIKSAFKTMRYDQACKTGSDVIGRTNILNGFTYNVTGCTSTNYIQCLHSDLVQWGAVSNQTARTVINPVMSARLTTKNSHHICPVRQG